MPERGPTRPFSDRENEIAEHIRCGLSYKEIGQELRPRLKHGTVRKMVERMAWAFDAYHEILQRCPPRQVILVYAIYQYIGKQSKQEAAD